MQSNQQNDQSDQELAKTNQEFATLDPDTIINAVESVGLTPNGQILALNSYENRVYRIGIDDGAPVVAKFYRPQRWSNEQVLEEHEFCNELVDADLPVVPPLRFTDQTLFHHNSFRFAIYPLQGGRAPEFDNLGNLRVMGRYLARMHAAAGAASFRYRPRIDIESFGRESAAHVLASVSPIRYERSTKL